MHFAYYFYGMNKYLLILVILFSSCKSDKKNQDFLTEDYNVKLEVYNFDELEPLLTKKDDKVYVVNFWATWCAPCIKELPYFEKLNEAYKSKNVEVILVSLDFPNQYEKRLKPYIKKNKLQSKVVALNDVDSNTWIPKIDKNWTGAIPATVIYSSEKRAFYERSFNYSELEEEVNKFLK